MNKQVSLVFAILLGVVCAVAGFLAGSLPAKRQVKAVVLVESLKDVSVYANGLLLVAKKDAVRTRGLLDQQLRFSLAAAEASADASKMLGGPMPSLAKGLLRAESYAKVAKDDQLARRIVALRLRLEQATPAK